MGHHLILGVAGTFGQHLAARLLRSGHIVTGLDVDVYGPGWEALKDLSETGPLSLVAGDLLDEDWPALLQGAQVEAQRAGQILSVHNLTLLHHGHNLGPFSFQTAQSLFSATAWFVECFLALWRASPEASRPVARIFLDSRNREIYRVSQQVRNMVDLFSPGAPLHLQLCPAFFLGAVSSSHPFLNSPERLEGLEGRDYTFLSPKGDISFSLPYSPLELFLLLQQDTPRALEVILQHAPGLPPLSLSDLFPPLEPASLYPPNLPLPPDSAYTLNSSFIRLSE